MQREGEEKVGKGPIRCNVRASRSRTLYGKERDLYHSKESFKRIKFAWHLWGMVGGKGVNDCIPQGIYPEFDKEEGGVRKKG